MTPSTLDKSEFRKLMGHFATGITVLTANDAAGAPMGMTANSFTSVSLDPLLILVCIAREASMHATLTTGAHFAVNILAAHQEGVSRRFAGKHEDRFDGLGYTTSPRGLLLLDGALAHLECARHATHEAGDHTIVLGRVLDGRTFDGRPILYYRGGYAALA